MVLQVVGQWYYILDNLVLFGIKINHKIIDYLSAHFSKLTKERWH